MTMETGCHRLNHHNTFNQKSIHLHGTRHPTNYSTVADSCRPGVTHKDLYDYSIPCTHGSTSKRLSVRQAITWIIHPWILDRRLKSAAVSFNVAITIAIDAIFGMRDPGSCRVSGFLRLVHRRSSQIPSFRQHIKRLTMPWQSRFGPTVWLVFDFGINHDHEWTWRTCWQQFPMRVFAEKWLAEKWLLCWNQSNNDI